MQERVERVNSQKSLILKETENYYTIVKGTLNTWMGIFSHLEAYDSISCVDIKKSLAWLMSAHKTRTTVPLRLCIGLCLSRAKRKPERTWFVNNANGR